MKRLFNKIIDIFKNFFLWVWKECRDWRTFVLLAVVCIVIGIPVWGGYLLFILFKWKWAVIMATACLAFWWIPGVPFFAISVSVTLAIKKLAATVFKRKKEKQGIIEACDGTEASDTQPTVDTPEIEDENKEAEK